MRVGKTRRWLMPGASAAAAMAAFAGTASAAGKIPPFHWSDWWLPPVYSEHGPSMDSLFTWIFWITMVTFAMVQTMLVVFLIKYRHREGKKKAQFIHGNKGLEMAWTIMPAIILAILALVSKQVWSNYRYSDVPVADRAQIMVIGEQFKWNVVYPGPDGAVGKYLAYPRPSDAKYRMMPFKTAVSKINDYISDENPLGKVISAKEDPAGEDDDWDPTPGRPIVVPLGKTVEVLLSSKDVLHDFFLPNFRVKLDAVPGMIGHIYFKPLKLSTEPRDIDTVALDDRLWVDRDTKGATGDDQNVFGIPDPGNPAKRIERFGTMRSLAQLRLIARNVDSPTQEQLEAEGVTLRADLKKAGIGKLIVTTPFEIVCEELCGAGHGTMRGELMVVTPEEYRNFIYKNAPPANPSTQPAAPPTVAQN